MDSILARIRNQVGKFVGLAVNRHAFRVKIATFLVEAVGIDEGVEDLFASLSPHGILVAHSVDVKLGFGRLVLSFFCHLIEGILCPWVFRFFFVNLLIDLVTLACRVAETTSVVIKHV